MCVVFEKSGRASYAECNRDQQPFVEQKGQKLYLYCSGVGRLHQHEAHGGPEEHDM
jgi:hypothetical protein